MSSKKPRSITLPGKGVFSDLTLRVKLILRLMGDRRVSPALKVLPVASAVYMLFPDLVPLFLDDAVVVWLGSKLFVELCPPAVVQEHMDQLRKVIPAQWQDAEDDNTVDAEYQEADRGNPSEHG